MPIKKVTVSMDTQILVEDDIDRAIRIHSKKNGVDPLLVKAIGLTESALYPMCFRLEPHLMKAQWYRNTIPEAEKKNKYAYCSYGFMQILYGIARHNGYRGKPMDLCLPDNSAKYAVKLIKKNLKRYKDNEDDAISAYNQGSNKRTSNGQYSNQSYVSKVKKHLHKLRNF